MFTWDPEGLSPVTLDCSLAFMEAEGVDGEIPLGGGNSSGRVVRVGQTVRKPWLPSTPAVVDYGVALRRAGIDIPRFLGRDREGRAVQEFLPGRLAIAAGHLSPSGQSRVGALVRAIHEASDAYRPAPGTLWEPVIPSPGHDLICHNDLAPWNLIVGERWAFIDWDGAGPSTRLWDLAYSAQAFTLNDPTREPAAAAGDLRAFVDGYGPDAALRSALPQAMADRASAMAHHLWSAQASGWEPWATMARQGHGEHWSTVTDFVARHQGVWAAAVQGS